MLRAVPQRPAPIIASCARPVRRGAFAAAVCLAVAAHPAIAQSGAAPGTDTVQPQPGPFGDEQDIQAPGEDPRIDVFPSINGVEDRTIGFEADAIEYDSGSDTVSATGDVILRSGDRSVIADRVTWDRTSGEIVASGAIRFVDEDGNQLYTDELVLDDEFRVGTMENLVLALRAGGRLAAERAERNEDGTIAVETAAYSGCPVTDANGCGRSPSWRITADRVVYDPDLGEIRFTGAHLELFGARILPLPGFAISTDGRAISGLLIPNVRLSASNGLELSGSYYWRLADNEDLTASAYIFTGALPMVSAQYRHLFDEGALQATAYATFSSRIPIGQTQAVPTEALRGYVATNGRFQLDPHWSITGSIRVASDRTFLRRYDISRDDTLRSVVEVERVDEDSYLSIAGWGFQTLRFNTAQGQVPLALPAIDYRRRIADPVASGQIQLQFNSLNIIRTEGQDTQRAFASARWDMRHVLDLGQVVTLSALVRGDVYHSSDNALTRTAIYRGEPGWQARGIAIAAIDVQWPFVGEAFGGTQVITPRVQVVASPPLANLRIPNEDARAIDLEDSNLFALNRFPGYDRVEDGIRIIYGVDWDFSAPDWRIRATIGQSYRTSDKAALLPDGTGLSDQFSDYVGRTEIRWRDFIQFTHRYRLDKDDFAVRRNEIDATIGTTQTYAEIGYLRLNRDISANIEDLRDREELRLAGRVAFADYWSVFASGVFNLTDREEDPNFVSDGFEPLRTRLGLAYEDDCIEMGLTWRQDFIDVGDAESGATFQVYLNLKNLGF